MKFNLYSTLGVKPKATLQEIKKAYRKIALENHPDKHPNNRKATKKMLEANEAYEILSNPSKKKEYDDALLRLLNSELEKEKAKQTQRKNNDTNTTVNSEKRVHQSVQDFAKGMAKSALVKVLRFVLRR